MISKDMTIAKVLELKPEAASIFIEFGMHCLGCAVAHGETIEQAAEVHGFDVEDLLKAINN